MGGPVSDGEGGEGVGAERGATGAGGGVRQGEGSAAGPFDAADFDVPSKIRCPFCEGEDTELHSAFGGQLSTATYWCRPCHTAFEWFKWERR